MAKMTIAGSIQNTRNSEADAQGYALPPIASNLKDGQIAINTSDSDPCIFFKSITGKIVKIPSEGVLVKALTDILGNSAADLDTLRKLIAQFEGSANDILPMLTALTDRVTAAETSLTSKADKSALNTTNTNLSNHTSSKSNPHAVTAEQVGALAVGATAADSAKLGGIVAANYYHKGNANLPTVDWTCKNLQANGIIKSTSSYYINDNRCITDNKMDLYFGGLDSTHTGVVVFRTKGVERVLIKNDGTFCVNGNVGINNPNPTEKLDVNGNILATNMFIGNSTTKNQVWHAGNSNKSDVDWTCKQLKAMSGYSSYTADGLFDVKAKPSIIQTPSVAQIRLGYCDNQAGLYAPRIGFEMGDKLWSTGISGADGGFHIGRGNYLGNSDIFIDSATGNIGLGQSKAYEKLHVNGNGLFNGNVTAKGDVVAKSTNAVVFSTSDAAAGATRLNDLIDVKLPTTLSAKMVLAYDPAQVNSDGSKGGYTFMPSAGTGTGTVSSTEIASLPEHNHNDIVYTSDERLKNNITDLKDRAIKMILSLAPKSFGWNDKAKRFGLNDSISYGLIAQEVEKVMPELVKPLGKEDYIGVDYIKIIPILLAGVQEQHKEIIALNQKLKTIQARANKAYGNETNNADEIANLKADNITLKAEIEELKMLINK